MNIHLRRAAELIARIQKKTAKATEEEVLAAVDGQPFPRTSSSATTYNLVFDLGKQP